MARRSLRPELNRIRAWVRQGRTDAWIAHQLEVTVQQIQAFKREQALEPGSEAEGAGALTDYDDEIDLRAEDDALIAAELDAAQAERSEDEEEDEEDDGEPRGRRRRGRRGGRCGRTRRRATGPPGAALAPGGGGHRPGGGARGWGGTRGGPAARSTAAAGAAPGRVEVAFEEDQMVIRGAGAEESDE